MMPITPITLTLMPIATEIRMNRARAGWMCNRMTSSAPFRLTTESLPNAVNNTNEAMHESSKAHRRDIP